MIRFYEKHKSPVPHKSIWAKSRWVENRIINHIGFRKCAQISIGISLINDDNFTEPHKIGNLKRKSDEGRKNKGESYRADAGRV